MTHISELVEVDKLDSTFKTLKNPNSTQEERDKASDDWLTLRFKLKMRLLALE